MLAVGRVIADLYANELHRPLEKVESFSRYLGGSAGNIAVGLARLGHQCGLISRVGDDGHGAFLRRYLEESGVDTRFVGVDPRYRTGLAFAALFPPQDSHVLFYRDPCADTQVELSDLDLETVWDARLLVVTGTTLVRSPMRETVLHLLTERRRRGKMNAMDIDYRPMLWSEEADSRLYYDWAIRQCDVLIGNEVEIAFAGKAIGRVGDDDVRLDDRGTPDRPTLEAIARHLLSVDVSQVVVKLGPRGSMVLTPDGLLEASGFSVDVVNTLGAGDGFAAGYCSGLLRGWPLDHALTYGNAVGAIVVSRHGCAPAIPTLDELDAFLRERGVRLGSPG